MSDLDYPYPRTAKEKEAAKEAMKEAQDKKRQEAESRAPTTRTEMGRKLKKGGMACSYKKGGSVSSASKRADGIAKKGKTKGRIR